MYLKGRIKKEECEETAFSNNELISVHDSIKLERRVYGDFKNVSFCLPSSVCNANGEYVTVKKWNVIRDDKDFIVIVPTI